MGEIKNKIEDLKRSYDLRDEIEKTLGAPLARNRVFWDWECPFHNERSFGAFKVYKENYHCFSCGANGDLFDWWQFVSGKSLKEVVNDRLPEDYKPDPERSRQLLEQSAKRLEDEIKRAQDVLSELRRGRKWEQYHENMDERAYALWAGRGVPKWYVDFVNLGYDPSHEIWSNGESYTTPTLTIPDYSPVTWDVNNINHRLLYPKVPGDKYRPERSGLPKSVYVADPSNPVKGSTVLVEGQIKAMVVFTTLETNDVNVIGMSGKSSVESVYDILENSETIYFIPDPDCFTDANPESRDKRSTFQKIVDRLGKERIRYVRLPAKVDDMIVENKLNSDWLKKVLGQSRIVP